MTIEQELLAATGFEPKRKYPDRQDYLAALARATNQLEDDAFDKLSEAAVDWFNAAAKGIGNKRDIEEFELFGEPEVPGDVTPREYEEDTLEAEVAEADEEEVVEPVKKPVRLKKDGTPAKPYTSGPPLLGKRFNKKMSHAETAIKLPLKPKPIMPDDDIIDVELDKWACIPGTKNAQAAELFENGARMADVTKTIGGTYYNLLARLSKAGHKVEKGVHGIIVLVHNPEVRIPKKSRYTPDK